MLGSTDALTRCCGRGGHDGGRARPVAGHLATPNVPRHRERRAARRHRPRARRHGDGAPAAGRHLGRAVATVTADEMGSALFRELRPGRHYAVSSGGAIARCHGPSVSSSRPAQSFYDGQDLVEGFQYLETRDGTELSINVVLPGPPEDGPYPTVVEYSGYDPSNPIAGLGGVLAGGIDPTPLCGELPILCKAPAEPASLLAGLMGFAVVGVNVRGTGCSGGRLRLLRDAAGARRLRRHRDGRRPGLGGRPPGRHGGPLVPRPRAALRGPVAAAEPRPPSPRCRCTATRAPGWCGPAGSSTPGSRCRGPTRCSPTPSRPARRGCGR